MSDRVVLIESDGDAAALVAREIAARGYVLERHRALATTVSDAAVPRLVIMDAGIVTAQELAVLEALRAAGCDVVLLSHAHAAAQQADRGRTGQEKAAATDRSPPIMCPETLLARLGALLPEPGLREGEEVLVFDRLRIRPWARAVHVMGRPVCLSPKEFALLHWMARHPGQILTRMQLLEHVWQLHFHPGTNVVDVHMGRLRRKLESAGVRAIQTARGEGYIFNPLPLRLS